MDRKPTKNEPYGKLNTANTSHIDEIILKISVNNENSSKKKKKFFPAILSIISKSFDLIRSILIRVVFAIHGL